MAGRAAERRIVAEANEERQAAEAQAYFAAVNPPLEGEYPEAVAEGEHMGHREHSAPWHPWQTVCQCGATWTALACWALTGDEPLEPEPGPCPVCVARGIPQDAS